MFTQAICLTHYSDILTARLELLGYKKFSGSCKATRDDVCICTCTNIEGNPLYAIITRDEALNDDHKISWVHSGTDRYVTDNESLAFALASLRDDDEDKYRIFTLECNAADINDHTAMLKPGELVFCTRDKWDVDTLEDGSRNPYSSRNVPAHKSTKEEIINYFSKDNKL